MATKEINVVYSPHSGERSLHYNGPEGKVWMSKTRSNKIPNVFIGCHSGPKIPGNKDNFLMLEPIVVHPKDFDINYLSNYNKIFTSFGKFFENTKITNKIVNINYGSHLFDQNIDSLINKWQPWEKRVKGVIIVAGGKSSNHNASIYSLREKLGDIFYNNGFQVARYGGVKGNKPPYFKGMLQDKIGEICKYRFHLCSENTYDEILSHNYFTEKMPHAIHGGAIPLYMGCYNIEDIAPKDTFFDLRKYISKNPKDGQINIDEKELIQALNSFSKTDFEKYQEAAKKYMKDPKGLFYHTDMKRYYRKMLEVL